MTAAPPSVLPFVSLLTGAAIWGVIWYPYRLLLGLGVGGVAASVATYGVALLLGCLLLRSHLRALRPTPRLVAIALAAATCNLGYVLATIHGEVMRVLLLFYLAPLWTVLLSRLLLGERLTAAGGGIIALSLLGAAVMLWHPELGAPWPRSGAEWIGLLSGLSFALTNVLIRRADDVAIETKALAVFVGVVVIGGALLGLGVEALPRGGGSAALALVVGVGVVLLATNLVVQYGLMRVPANRAIVIMLSELVFAALSSWWLAGETMALRDWIGGSLIAAASLFSARLETPAGEVGPQRQTA